jgi:hypothetical protein
MRWLALVSLLTAPACFTEAPGLDEAESSSSESSGSGGLEESEGGSSSSGGPVDPLDAYGPCETDADCPLIPGDDGEYGESPRCVQGTCSIRCADASGGGDMACPGYTLREPVTPQSPRAIICQDGYCTIQFDPFGEVNSLACPDGMGVSDTMTVPDLDCVWEP